MLKNYRDLKVWQKSYNLCLDIYKITKEFPKEEQYSLTSQIRRAAVSVASNIAEGYGRKTTADYIRFLYMAYGSNCELETQILLSGGLCYLETCKLEMLKEGIGEVERMLKALIKSLERNHLNPRTLELVKSTNREKNLRCKYLSFGKPLLLFLCYRL